MPTINNRYLSTIYQNTRAIITISVQLYCPNVIPITLFGAFRIVVDEIRKICINLVKSRNNHLLTNQCYRFSKSGLGSFDLVKEYNSQTLALLLVPSGLNG